MQSLQPLIRRENESEDELVGWELQGKRGKLLKVHPRVHHK